MGMIGYLFRVKSEELEAMLKDSSLLDEKIDLVMESGSPDLLDLDKAWEAIFFMLTGYGIAELEKATPPLSWSLFSGQTVDDDQDLGYGPGNYCTAEQVKEVNAALKNISDNDMVDRFDGKQMELADIYPSHDWNEKQDLEYIMDNFRSLKAFYAESAANSQAIITFIA